MSTAPNVRAMLDAQGRSQRWLAQQTGYTEQHVSTVLSGKRVGSTEFYKACLHALGSGEHRRLFTAHGRVLSVPVSTYTRLTDGTLSRTTAETLVEDLWKAAWIEEHGQAALAAAAERAYIAAIALNEIDPEEQQ